MERLSKQINKTDRIAFVVAMVSGVLTHLYALANKLPTFDDLMCLNSFGGGLSLGRWGLEILGLAKHKLFGNYSTPSINGLLTIFFVAVAAVLLCRLLEIQNRMDVVITSVLLTVFPVITGYMTFVYTAYYYCFALDVMLVGLYFIKNRASATGLVLGAILIGVSVGIYQAYLPFAITLLLCLLLLMTIREEKPTIVVKEGVAYLVTIMGSLLLYFVVNSVLQAVTGIKMSAMKGGERVGSVLLDKKLGIIPYIYASFLKLISENYYGITGKNWLRVGMVLLLLITVLLMVYLIVKSFQQKKRGIAWLQILIAVLLPLALHSLYAMVEEQYFYTLMLYTDVMLFIIPVMLLEHVDLQQRVGIITKGIVGVILVYASILYMVQANATYLQMDLGLSAAKSYYTTLITQIKSVDNYNPDYPVVIVGHVDDPTIFDLHNAYFNDVEIGGAYGSSEAVKGMYIDLFLKQYCGYDQNVTTDAREVNREVLQEMKCYPQMGSIQVLKNRIIVKLSDDY